MIASSDMVVRTNAEGLVLLPGTADIIVPDYADVLIAKLEASPKRWVSVLSEVLSRPTPPAWVQPRGGPHNMVLYYVEGAYAKITRQAISLLGIASDLEILQTDVSPDEVHCLTKLTFKYNNETTSSMQWGLCMRRSGVASGYTKKGAATDGLKKCMNEFGWAMDVYSTEANVAEPPDPTVMKATALEGLYEIGSRGGMLCAEVDAYIGSDPAELSSADLTSAKRKLERKIRAELDTKTVTEVKL